MAGSSRWLYTTDDGRTFRLRAATRLTSQVDGESDVKVGGEAATMAAQLPPRGFKPRVAYVTSAAGVTRSVVCYDPAAPLFAEDGVTINLLVEGASTAFTGNKFNRSEHVPRGIADNS